MFQSDFIENIDKLCQAALNKWHKFKTKWQLKRLHFLLDCTTINTCTNGTSGNRKQFKKGGLCKMKRRKQILAFSLAALMVLGGGT